METNKAIALAQHLNEKCFEVGNDNTAPIYFMGDEDALYKEWNEDYKEFIYPTFFEYCQTECETLEEWAHCNEDDYKVLTDDEANEEWDESLENYIDECIIYELPKQYQCYFDREKWKDDARYDGRGHCLSSYDGTEYEETIFYDGQYETFYIYRIN